MQLGFKNSKWRIQYGGPFSQNLIVFAWNLLLGGFKGRWLRSNQTTAKVSVIKKWKILCNFVQWIELVVCSSLARSSFVFSVFSSTVICYSAAKSSFRSFESFILSVCYYINLSFVYIMLLIMFGSFVCINDPDRFCYVCGEYRTSKGKYKISKFVKDFYKE